MSTEIQRWADAAMYRSEEMPFSVNEDGPRVTLLTCTRDPLGAVAAMAKMYKGEVVRDLSKDVTDAERRHYLSDILKTHLKAPLEAITLHFMVEGVTRSFTHQMVRQRTAVYAQESLRFAVKDGYTDEVAYPPSIRALRDDAPARVLWDQAIAGNESAYSALVDAGIPAEDARGLLPHNITTRLNYITNLRNLQEHGGMRLCTQAQFEWKAVFIGIVNAIRNYPQEKRNQIPISEWWQFDLLADIFRPICYLTGKCEFMSDLDRYCSIRERVEANHSMGRKSSEWDEAVVDGDDRLVAEAINPIEWLGMPDAAISRGMES